MPRPSLRTRRFDKSSCRSSNRAMDHDPVLDAVGPRLRTIRQRRGATLAELSETTGISVSTLSRLESGGRRPTLELLLALARAHAVTLEELVDSQPTRDPSVQLR